MQGLGCELGDDTGGGDQKQIREERLRLNIQKCIDSIEHACQCKDANCNVDEKCPKVKRIVLHAETCKRVKTDCKLCKQMIALMCYHAKFCQRTICPLPFCVTIRKKFTPRELAQHIDLMYNCGMTETIKQASPGSSNLMNQLKPDTEPLASQGAPHPGIDMEISAYSPVGALQAVQQVQAAAASQTVPRMIPTDARPAAPCMVGPGNNTVVNHPTANPALMCAQHMQNPMIQMMPEALNQMVGMKNKANGESSNFNQNMQPQDTQPGQPMGLRPQSKIMGANNMSISAGSVPSAVRTPQGTSNPETSASSTMQQRSNKHVQVQKLITFLKSVKSPHQQEKILNIFKSNPRLMAFIKRKCGQSPVQQQPNPGTSTSSTIQHGSIVKFLKKSLN